MYNNYEMVLVKGGKFMMGTNASDAYMYERPAHEVTLGDFFVGKTQVTQALWEEMMGDNPSYFEGDDLPITDISWYDCQHFIKKLNELTGKKYRLPTEAEWEYAARGGLLSRGYKYPGSDCVDDVAWHYGNSDDEPHPVGKKKPNELGLYDMSGNVWEWCSDWYGEYTSSSQENPKGATSGQYRVLRGSSWSFDAWSCRVSYRGISSPDSFRYNFGLRLAMSVNNSNN